QGELIEQLQENSTRVANEPDAAAAPDSENSGGVTEDYIDERIEDFETAAQSRFLISGYGQAEYIARDDAPDGFAFGFNPGFHFRMSDRLHFNGELKFGLERDDDGGTDTEVELEFAQIDYLLTDWMVLSGGFFTTPFNSFGSRLHPTWINKMATRPPIYGGDGIMEVAAQVGAMVSGGQALWDDSSKFNYAVYLVNAPTMRREDGDEVALDLDFKSTPNQSSEVGYGTRVGFLPIPTLEIGASYQTGELSASDDRYNLVGADLWYIYEGVELRAEYMRLSQEFEGETPSTQGYYVQASYRLDNMVADSGNWWSGVGQLEPVIRWGQIVDYDPNEREQLALGLNFWLYESAPLKLTYEINSGKGGEDRFFVQFAYGF
ncbi:MAG: hypothetical protein ACC652_12240, partial [Acidimicrobiales bacterium]